MPRLIVGLVIGAQAFNVNGRRYATAIVLAMLPSLAEWATGQIDNALADSGTNSQEVGMAALINSGVIYDGLKLFGQGAVLVGIVLGTRRGALVRRPHQCLRDRVERIARRPAGLCAPCGYPPRIRLAGPQCC